MKIYIKNEEWYPVRVIDEERLGIPLDVPKEKAREWSAAQTAFEDAQEEIEAAIKKARFL